MAQYEKLINLSLLSEFLTKAKTIFAPKITASGILKGDGNGGVSVATAGTDYATAAQVNAKYTKPSGGIPASDLASGVIPTVPSASSTTPKMDGTASAGTGTTWAKGDHVHPTDTSRQAKITASGILKGDGAGGVSAATAGTDYATPAQVNAKAASTSVPASASVDASTGVMSFKNSGGTQLFTVTLPKYNGEVV